MRRLAAFDVLRIGAALIVIFDHSFYLPQGREKVPLLWDDYGWAWGRVGVAIFFAISGYLVTLSWLSDSRVRQFLGKRALRVWPALAVTVIAAALIIGPIVSSASTANYWTDPHVFTFIVRGLLIVPFQEHLPGVFTDQPIPQVVGVIWTLALEVGCYLAVALCGALGLLKPRWTAGFALLMTVASWVWLHKQFDSPLIGQAAKFQLIAIFFAGATAALYRDRLLLTWPLAAGAALVLGLSLLTPLSLLAVPTVAYLVIFAGTRRLPPALHVGRWGDPSYGMYLYGFVLQQLMVAAGILTDQPGWFFVASLLITVPLGYLSWHLFERRVLAAGKRRLGTTGVPRALPDAVAP